MSEKKQLNQEELEKVSGGEADTCYCWICDRETKTKIVQKYIGGTNTFKTVCSVCETPYGEGHPFQ